MSSNPDAADGRTDPDYPASSDTEPNADHPLAGLKSVVVNYGNRPDRRTVYPEGLSNVDRMSTWLTADDDAFVDLEEAC